MRQNSRAGGRYHQRGANFGHAIQSARAIEGTGGFLIANTNDFRKPFQQLTEDLDTHYEAIYRSTATRYDGRLRKIEVKLARRDVQVESRTGYYAMPDLKGSGALTPLESTGMAVLNAEPRPHSFDFHLTAYHFAKDGANTSAALAFELPSAKLGSTADPARKTHKFEIGLLALVHDAMEKWWTSTASTSPTTSPTPTWLRCARNS